jgi:hypothetical protein
MIIYEVSQLRSDLNQGSQLQLDDILLVKFFTAQKLSGL